MNIHDFAATKRLDLRQVMDFSSGVNPLGPSNRAKHAIRKGIKYLAFPPDENSRHLKQYICKKEQIGEDNLIFGQGLPHMLHVLIKAVLPKAVAVLSPVSEVYGEVLGRHNIKVITHPLKEESCFLIDIEKLIRDIGDADMVILANPHDITGTALSTENLVRLIEEADRRGKVLVIDETYMEFTQFPSTIRQIVGSVNAVIIRTFSVFHALSGLPVGYVIGSPGLVNKLGSIAMPLQISSLAYMAALASLKDKGYRKRTLKFIEEEKRYMIEKLKGTGGLEFYDTPCNSLLLNIKKPIPNLKELFLKTAILIDEYKGEEGNIYMKLPVKTHKFNARFIKSLKKIMEV